MLCTSGGLPVAFALTGAKTDERTTLLGMLQADLDLLPCHHGQNLIADMQDYGRDLEHTLAAEGVHLLRKARKGEPPRPGAHLFKPLRQTIESINQTFKSSTSNATADAPPRAPPSA
ncbi:putative transposase [[Actinomadura] parvosata subsp. kistnae]|nr:putative transposase [Actinomadura parvosata subsp. kistnae]